MTLQVLDVDLFFHVTGHSSSVTGYKQSGLYSQGVLYLRQPLRVYLCH